MKENMWAVLVTCVILQYFGEVDAYSVHLNPSPFAEVEEGDTLNLNCNCSGSNNPAFINWYLNNDTLGLVIEASSCKYQTTPGQYEIDRYNKSCHGKKFNLTIASISKDKDHNATWKCDTTVIGMNPPLKASTTILVKDAGQNGQFDESKTVEVTGIVVGVISAFTVVIVVAVYFLYRKRRNDHLNKINEDHDQDHDQDHHEVTMMMTKNDDDHDEDYDDDHEQMGTPRADGHACGK